MTDRSALERAFARNDDFVETDAGYTVATATLDSTVRLDPPTIEVAVHMPTLTAVVTDGPIAEIVHREWAKTLSRRLQDGGDVVAGTVLADPVIEESLEQITVRYRLRTDSPAQAVKDAKALVEFVVGTYVQGAIPGYSYDEPLAGLLANARHRAQEHPRD